MPYLDRPSDIFPRDIYFPSEPTRQRVLAEEGIAREKEPNDDGMAAKVALCAISGAVGFVFLDIIFSACWSAIISFLAFCGSNPVLGGIGFLCGITGVSAIGVFGAARQWLGKKEAEKK